MGQGSRESLNRTNVELKLMTSLSAHQSTCSLESNQCGIETFYICPVVRIKVRLESNQCGIETAPALCKIPAQIRLESNQCGIETLNRG